APLIVNLPDEDAPNALPAPHRADRSRREVATYLSHMTAEMGAMARAAGYDLLAYFLDMARIEAKIQAKQQQK
ncbi:MAG: hypothetical protein J0H41_14660, partial [Rhizobiales bacterium]|nr:hypothetical protein [Hyphomicrobiales bacterium]